MKRYLVVDYTRDGGHRWIKAKTAKEAKIKYLMSKYYSVVAARKEKRPHERYD